jgi:hypothetical protein
MILQGSRRKGYDSRKDVEGGRCGIGSLTSRKTTRQGQRTDDLKGLVGCAAGGGRWV